MERATVMRRSSGAGSLVDGSQDPCALRLHERVRDPPGRAGPPDRARPAAKAQPEPLVDLAKQYDPVLQQETLGAIIDEQRAGLSA